MKSSMDWSWSQSSVTSKEDRRLLSLDVKARTAIGNSLPYHIYCFIQNCESAKEMMEKLTSMYNEETSSNDEEPKGKCLMARINDFHTDVLKENPTHSMMISLSLSHDAI